MYDDESVVHLFIHFFYWLLLPGDRVKYVGPSVDDEADNRSSPFLDTLYQYI